MVMHYKPQTYSRGKSCFLIANPARGHQRPSIIWVERLHRIVSVFNYFDAILHKIFRKTKIFQEISVITFILDTKSTHSFSERGVPFGRKACVLFGKCLWVKKYMSFLPEYIRQSLVEKAGNLTKKVMYLFTERDDFGSNDFQGVGDNGYVNAFICDNGFSI